MDIFGLGTQYTVFIVVYIGKLLMFQMRLGQNLTQMTLMPHWMSCRRNSDTNTHAYNHEFLDSAWKAEHYPSSLLLEGDVLCRSWTQVTTGSVWTTSFPGRHTRSTSTTAYTTLSHSHWFSSVVTATSWRLARQHRLCGPPVPASTTGYAAVRLLRCGSMRLMHDPARYLFDEEFQCLAVAKRCLCKASRRKQALCEISGRGSTAYCNAEPSSDKSQRKSGFRRQSRKLQKILQMVVQHDNTESDRSQVPGWSQQRNTENLWWEMSRDATAWAQC